VTVVSAVLHDVQDDGSLATGENFNALAPGSDAFLRNAARNAGKPTPEQH